MSAPEGHPPPLDWRERLAAWVSPKERLQAEIKRYKLRLHAMMCAKEQALTNALLFENEDITRWLQDVASSDKGALGVRLKESDERVKELQKRNLKLIASEENARNILDAVIHAWEVAAQMKTEDSRWDSVGMEWTPVIREPSLPQEVVDALKVWINKQKPAPPPRRRRPA